MTPKLCVLHVITGLLTGGAERALCSVVKALVAKNVRSSVVALRDGPLRVELQDAAIHTEIADVRNPVTLASYYRRVRRLCDDQRPAVVQGWMYHGNLVALGLANALGVPSIWGVRQGINDSRHEKWSTRVAIRACATLSARVSAIIYNSDESCRMHTSHGFADRAAIVIPNGFDTSRFKPQPELRAAVRAAIGVPDGAVVIGHVARWHSIKNHEMFVEAAKRVLRGNGNAWVVMIGKCVDGLNDGLASLIAGYDRFRLLGERHDLERLYAAMDVCCVSSWSESFPNVIGEAMASGVPCVATRVGAAETIIGGTGILVPPGDVGAMAAAIDALLRENDSEYRRRHDLCRQRVADKFSIEECARRYRDVYDAVIQTGDSVASYRP